MSETPTTEQPHAALVAALVTKSHHCFTAGQKVYCYSLYNADAIQVVGRHRRKHWWICAVIPSKDLANFRLKDVYDLGALHAIERHYSGLKASSFGGQRLCDRLKEIEAWNQMEAMCKLWIRLFRLPIALRFNPDVDWSESAEQYATRHPEMPEAKNYHLMEAWLRNR